MSSLTPRDRLHKVLNAFCPDSPALADQLTGILLPIWPLLTIAQVGAFCSFFSDLKLPEVSQRVVDEIDGQVKLFKAANFITAIRHWWFTEQTRFIDCACSNDQMIHSLLSDLCGAEGNKLSGGKLNRIMYAAVFAVRAKELVLRAQAGLPIERQTLSD